jgi:ABC-type uncharacterized transport system auxiliary subunit
MNRRSFILAGSALALAACSSAPVVRDTFYRLGDPAPQTPLGGGPIKGTVEVPPFRADGVVNERSILFREGARALAQYTYHAWTEPPAALVQQALVGALRRAQAFTTVATPDMRIDRDFELTGTLRRLEHVVAGGGGASSVELEIALRRVRDSNQLLAKTYRGEHPAAADNVDAAVDGFTKALDVIMTAFLADLAAVPKS